MKTTSETSGFTGRHMLAIMLAFFGVIIVVNVTMAVVANTSWTGFVVKNSYIASQEFNHKAQEGRAQAALGWNVELTIADGTLSFSLTDADGAAVPLAGGSATFRRPVSDVQDETVTLVAHGAGVLEGPAAAGDGRWIVEILADAGLETPYRVIERLHVRGGIAQ